MISAVDSLWQQTEEGRRGSMGFPLLFDFPHPPPFPFRGGWDVEVTAVEQTIN